MPDDLSAYLDPAPRRRGNYDDLIQKHAQRTGLDPELVRAVVGQESGGNPRAVSPKGAQGIGQLMPATAKRFGVKDPYDPDENLRGATDYLKFLNDRYGGNRDFTLAAYNAGEGAVDRYKGIPPYRETQNYVRSINARLGQRPQKPTGDLDSYLDPISTEQTPPPTSLQTKAKPSESATPPALASPAPLTQRRRPSKPLTYSGTGRAFGKSSISPDVIRAGVAAAERPSPQIGSNLIDKSVPDMVGLLTAARNSPEAQQREAIRQEVVAERAKRKVPFATLGGVTELITNPQHLFQSEESIVNDEVANRLHQQQLAREPEVTAIRKEYGAMPTAERSVTAPLARGGASMLNLASGLASLGGYLPKGYIPAADQLSEWAKKRAEIIETGAGLSPLKETDAKTLAEVERSVPEKVATGIADLGVGLGEIILLKKATKLPFNQLLALEGALKNSDKPLAQQVGSAAQGYALGSVLEQNLSRPAAAALFGAPTGLQTGYEVSQGRMSPLDAAIQTGVQTAAGAVLGGGKRELPTEAETPTREIGLRERMAQRGQASPSPIVEPRVPTDLESVPMAKKRAGRERLAENAAPQPGEPELPEEKFYLSYYQHKVLREGADLEQLKREGWKGGIGPQALPAMRGGEPSNVVDAKYGVRAGETVILVPKSAIRETPNGSKIKEGWKPKDSEIVVADYDNQPAYELYKKGLASSKPAAAPNKAVPSIEEYLNEPQTKVQPPVEAQREAIEPAAREGSGTKTGSPSDGPVSEPLQRGAPTTATTPVDRLDAGDVRLGVEEPQRFYHRDFGEVIKTEDQSGARSGRTRVQEVDNPDAIHYVKTAQLTGRGNERMVPVKSEPLTAPVEPSAKPLPELKDNYRKPLKEYADTLYREVSPDGALDMLPTSRRTTDIADVYLSNTPDLALGQGRNKGILLEFEPRDIEGQVNRSKPAWEPLYQQGQAEFIARYNKQSQYQDALRAVTIRPDVKMSRVERLQLDRALKEMVEEGWSKRVNDDGSTTYQRPHSVPVSEAPTPVETAPTVEPEPSQQRKLGEEAGAIDVDLLTLGIRPFAKEVAEKGRTGIQGVKEIADGIRSILAPATRGPEARTTAAITRANASEMARAHDIAEKSLEGARNYFSKQKPDANHDFIDRMERGQVQPDPNTQKFADTLRDLLDERRDQIRALGTGKLESFIKDYFPHIWKDPTKAETFFGQGRRPLEGTKSFLKERTIPFTKDGLAFGLEPVSNNPVDLAVLKLREMDKYLMAHKTMMEMKENGLLKFIKSSERLPEGYKKIDDRVATVFGGPSSRPEGGQLIRGYYIAPEPAAKILNNYLSPGLEATALRTPYRAWRATANLMNQAQLGFSFFHGGFTTLDAMVSRTAAGLEDIFRHGKPLRGIKTLASTPLSPLTNLAQGSKLLSEWYKPGSQGAEIAKLTDAMQEAGGRARMDRFYTNDAVTKFKDVLKQGNLIGAALRLPSAAIEKATAPVMEWLVPRQKAGIFAEMAKRELERLGPSATREQTRQALAKAWDSVDNRMGQMVYDNIFWNKVTKDLAMASVRSVGWNLGTAREVAGGLVDYATLPKRALSKGRTEPLFTHKMAYATALPLVVGTMGAMTQYLLTGKGPEELKDYFFPKTGLKDENGNDERIAFPSYMKDIFHFKEEPTKVVGSKLHPLISTIGEMLSNRDYYGTKIRNEDDPVVQQAKDVAKHLGKSFVPFSVRGYQKEAERGAPLRRKVLPFIGITPAPSYINQTPAEKLMSKLAEERMPAGSRTKEEAERSQLRHKLQTLIRKGQNVDQQIQEGVDKGILKPDDARGIQRDAKQLPVELRFKRLGAKDAINVYRIMSSTERAIVKDELEKKYRLIDSLPLDEQEKVRSQYRELGIGQPSGSRQRPERPSRAARPARATRQ